MNKKLFLILILLFTILLSGCSVEQTTYSGGGVSITLSEGFEEVQYDNWDFYIINSENMAFMSKRFTRHQTVQNVDLSTLSIEEYMSLCIANNGWDATIYSVERPIELFDPFCYCYYADNNQTYGYMMMIMADDNYFYNMHIALPYAKFLDSKQMLMEIAINIKLS